MWIRLKLMAPFQSPREPRLRGAVSASSPPAPPLARFFRLAMAALRLLQWGLARHGRPTDLLAQGGTLFASGSVELDPLAAGNRFVDGLGDGDVDETFLAGGLGRALLAHALREVHQLRRELVALGELLFLLLLADGELVAQALGVFIRRVDDDAALGADDLVARAVRGSEAADEVR